MFRAWFRACLGGDGGVTKRGARVGRQLEDSELGDRRMTSEWEAEGKADQCKCGVRRTKQTSFCCESLSISVHGSRCATCTPALTTHLRHYSPSVAQHNRHAIRQTIHTLSPFFASGERSRRSFRFTPMGPTDSTPHANRPHRQAMHSQRKTADGMPSVTTRTETQGRDQVLGTRRWRRQERD